MSDAPAPHAEPPERLGSWRRAAFAAGNAGFQLSDRVVVAILVYYYLPPDGRDLTPQVSEQVFLGVLTAFGLAMLLGRVVDSLADPLIGHASDRSRNAFGRRRIFLAVGLLPMNALPVLGFFPPGPPGSSLNFVWLLAVVALYFVFFTVYVAPYLALFPEISHSHEERVTLSTLLGAAAVPVGIFGFAWLALVDWGRSAGLSGEQALRAVVIGAAVLGALLCLLPILAVDEKRHARHQPSELSLRKAVGATFRNRAFLLYLAAQAFFIFGINMAAPLLPYMAAVMGRSDSFAAGLGAVLFTSILVSFAIVQRRARRVGARRMLVAATLLFGLALCGVALLRADPAADQHTAWNLTVSAGLVLAMGAPIATFIVLPNVVIGQLVDADAARTGAHRAAMYFGMQGFLTKWIYGVALAALAFLFARFGNGAAEPLGVQLAGLVAGCACLVSSLLFRLYPEEEVIAAGSASVGVRSE